jgi:hypothetical protein
LPYHGEHDLGLALHVRVKDTKNVLELAFLRNKERLFVERDGVGLDSRVSELICLCTEKMESSCSKVLVVVGVRD